MDLTVDSLRASGGFTGAPVKKSIEWKQGGEGYQADVYVRKLSYHSAISDAEAITGNGDLAAARIAHCVCDAKGSPIFKISDVTGLHDDGSPVIDDDTGEPRGSLSSALGTALLVAISEVNELGKTKGRNSRRKRKSGTS
jgi:hypothetical protein